MSRRRAKRRHHDKYANKLASRERFNQTGSAEQHEEIREARSKRKKKRYYEEHELTSEKAQTILKTDTILWTVVEHGLSHHD